DHDRARPVTRSARHARRHRGPRPPRQPGRGRRPSGQRRHREVRRHGRRRLPPPPALVLGRRAQHHRPPRIHPQARPQDRPAQNHRIPRLHPPPPPPPPPPPLTPSTARWPPRVEQGARPVGDLRPDRKPAPSGRRSRRAAPCDGKCVGNRAAAADLPFVTPTVGRRGGRPRVGPPTHFPQRHTSATERRLASTRRRSPPLWSPAPPGAARPDARRFYATNGGIGGISTCCVRTSRTPGTPRATSTARSSAVVPSSVTTPACASTVMR